MNALHWIATNYGKILAVAVTVLPSVITALTNYPKAQSTLRALLDILSALTHKDSPNLGLKVPVLHRSLPPVGVSKNTLRKTPADKADTRKIELPPAALLALLWLGLVSFAGCCHFWPGRTACVVQNDVVNCLKAEAGTLSINDVAELVDALAPAFQSGEPNWTLLAALEAKYGVPLITCLANDMRTARFNALHFAKGLDSAKVAAGAEKYLMSKPWKVAAK